MHSASGPQDMILFIQRDQANREIAIASPVHSECLCPGWQRHTCISALVGSTKP